MVRSGLDEGRAGLGATRVGKSAAARFLPACARTSPRTIYPHARRVVSAAIARFQEQPEIAMPRTFNPVKLLQRLRLSLQKKALRRRYGQDWEEGEKRFLKRSYKSYDEYITHQQSKLELHQFGEYDAKFRDVLQQRLRETGIAWNGKTVLCLAARLG